MSSPFSTASLAGYSAEEIIKFLLKTPGMGKKIQQSLAMGYTTEDILNFLDNTAQGKSPRKSKGKQSPSGYKIPFTDEEGRLTEAQRQDKAEKKNRRQSVLNQTLDPRNMLGAALGAGIGYATGGPAGAIGGAIGGSSAYSDLLKQYEEKIASGSDMSFYDFVKMMTKAAAKGTAVGFTYSQLANVLKNISPFGKEREGNFEFVNEEDIPSDLREENQIQPKLLEGPKAPVEENEITPEPPTSPVSSSSPQQTSSLEKSYDFFKNRGVSNMIDSISQQLKPEEGIRAIKSLWGNSLLKEIKQETGRNPEEVVKEAFIYSKNKNQTKGNLDTSLVKEEIKKEPIQKENKSEVKPKSKSNKDQLEFDFEKERQSMSPQQESYHEIFDDRVKLPGKKENQFKAKDITESLKSSNIRSASYNADDNSMRVLFSSTKGKDKGGEVYTFSNVDKKTFDELTEGKSKPVTEGSNSFSVWFSGKNKSLGATFNEKIKNKEEFNPIKLPEGSYTVDESIISQADRSHLISDIFEPFKSLREKGKKKTLARAYKESYESIKDLDEESIVEILSKIVDRIRSSSKNKEKFPVESKIREELEKELGVSSGKPSPNKKAKRSSR